MEITGTNGSDTLAGTAGDDVINGLGGADNIEGKEGNDVINGGADGDTINAGFGDDVVDGGDGNDAIGDYHAGSDILRGGAGNDSITLHHMFSPSVSETIVINGETGDDLVTYFNSSRGTALIDLGEGADRLTLSSVGSSALTVTLGAGQDLVAVQRYAVFVTAPIFTDFITGVDGDVLDLGDYIAGTLVNWDGSNPFGAGGYLRLLQSGSTTILQADRDGANSGTYASTTLLTFENTDSAQFTAANFGGYAPDGSAPQGGAIIGTEGFDMLAGTVGDDVVSGLGGSDSIDGKAGNDVLEGGADGDTIQGGVGNDFIDGGDGADFIYDAGGSDTLRGGAGEDMISVYRPGGGPSIPTETLVIEAGLGDDRVVFRSSSFGSAAIDLGDGADRLTLDSASNMTVTLTLGAGQDLVTLQPYAFFSMAPVFTDFATGAQGDVLDFSNFMNSALSNWDGSNPFGAGGHLRLVQSEADTLLQVDRDGAGGTVSGYTDLITFRNADATLFTAANFGGYAPDGGAAAGKSINGTATGDVLNGTAGDDVIAGLGGFDVIDGKAGDDVIDGGADSDTIQGGIGDDTVDGGDGNDLITDTGGSDTLRGGAGNDTINVYHSNSGPNTATEMIVVEGGTGDDQVNYFVYTRGTGLIDLGDGADRLALGSGPAAVRATLGTGRDGLELSAPMISSLAAPIITDFTGGPAGDNVLFTSSFTYNLQNWDGTSNPFGAGGYLRLMQAGADTLFQIDRDGAAGKMSGFTTLAMFENTDAATLTADNFSGFAPTVVNAAEIATAFVTAPALVSEGDGTFRLSLTLKNAASVSTTVSMAFLADRSTAAGGSDVEAGGFSGAFSFTQSPAGDYRIDLGSVTVIDDALIEDEETIAIRVTASGQVFETGTDSTVVFVKLLSDDDLVTDVLGTDAGETLNGTGGGDRILGFGGKDALHGGEGDDRLDGGRGDDVLFGGAGADGFLFEPMARGEKDVIKDFGGSDRLLSTVKLDDSNGDGVIGFGRDRALDIGGGEVRVYSETGKILSFLVYQGEFVEGGVTYHSYGLTGG